MSKLINRLLKKVSTIIMMIPFTVIGSTAQAASGFSPDDWRKPPQSQLIKQLTKDQYKVTQKNGTESAFRNLYWDNKAAGIYVDIVSGEPLFSSMHKYDSGTGWPSFWQPLSEDNLVLKADHKLWMKRTEVRSRWADSHLGHVFDDGPSPTGKRYCINSASLRFIPVAELNQAGYGELVSLFKTIPVEPGDMSPQEQQPQKQ